MMWARADRDWSWLGEGAFLEAFVGAFIVVGLLGLALRRVLGRTTYGPWIWACVLAVGLLWVLLGLIIPPISDELSLVGAAMAMGSIMYGIRWFFTGQVVPGHENLDEPIDGAMEDDGVIGPTADAP